MEDDVEKSAARRRILERAHAEESLPLTLAHIIFLLHFRSILIVTLPLPVSVLISFILMREFGITSNIMSLYVIAIAIGVLVASGDHAHGKYHPALRECGSGQSAPHRIV